MEIRNELIAAQMYQIEKESKDWSDSTDFKTLLWIYKERWDMLFDLKELGDLSKPLSPKILSDPYHKITRHLLYLYSMETFIYQDLN